MTPYKVIIIDDERLAREEIKRYLKDDDSFKIVGEASHVEEAIVLITSENPDLIFLDIQMPEKSGFDLLNELTTTPEIIFTTAYSEYATKAFEVNAVDYLVKPIRMERFDQSIKKVKKELSRVVGQRENLSANHKIFIKDGEKCFLIPLSEIRYIESLENYVRFHFNEDKAMLKKSLNSIEEKLDPKVFFRINRSEIINLNFIHKISPGFKNKLKIELETGETFDVSSRQSVRFKNRNSL